MFLLFVVLCFLNSQLSPSCSLRSHCYVWPARSGQAANSVEKQIRDSSLFTVQRTLLEKMIAMNNSNLHLGISGMFWDILGSFWYIWAYLGLTWGYLGILGIMSYFLGREFIKCFLSLFSRFHLLRFVFGIFWLHFIEVNWLIQATCNTVEFTT